MPLITLKKPNNSMSLSLLIRTQQTLAILKTKPTQITLCSPNVSSDKFSVLNNGKTLLRKGSFPFPLPRKPMTTMTTEWLGSGLFFIVLKLILGFLIFTTIAQLNSLSGSTIGGHGSDAPYLFYQLKHKEDGNSGKRTCPLWKLIQKNYNFFVFST